MTECKRDVGRPNNGLAVFGLLFALAATAHAAPSTAGCLNVGAPDNKISQQCETVAASPSLKGYEAGIASYNAARAYLSDAAAMPNASGQFVKAAELLDRSFNRLTDAALLSSDRGTLGFSKKNGESGKRPLLRDFVLIGHLPMPTPWKGSPMRRRSPRPPFVQVSRTVVARR